MKPPIIHRDIKPSNIIITGYNRAVLLDFNAAKSFSSSEDTDTVLLGTSGYAAPEQYGFGASSPQTDIYALGVVLKECLAASENPPDRLLKLAERCTRLEPEDRFSSVEELASEIRKGTDEPTDPEPKKRGFRFLPPGFRTLTPWKMLLGTAGYLLLFFCVTLRKTGILPGIPLKYENGGLLLPGLLILFLTFNYLGVQVLFPLCRSRSLRLRILGIILADAFLVILFILALLLYRLHTLTSVISIS